MVAHQMGMMRSNKISFYRVKSFFFVWLSVMTFINQIRNEVYKVLYVKYTPP
jgi:hypothetical protein